MVADSASLCGALWDDREADMALGISSADMRPGHKDETNADFPVPQWLRLRLPLQGVQDRSLVRELRSHWPRGQNTET